MGGGSAGLKLLLFPSIPGSAVCAFYMEEVEQVFTGRFKEQRSGDLSWTAVPDEQVPRPRWVGLGPGLLPVCRRVLIRLPLLSRPGTCAGDGAAAHLTSSVQFPDETLAFIKSYPLMDEAVPAVNHRPVFTRTSSRCVSSQDLPGPPRTHLTRLCGSGRSKLTQIAVDVSAGPGKDRTVMFLGSEDGRILKLVSNTSAGARLLEDIHVYDPSR